MYWSDDHLNSDTRDSDVLTRVSTSIDWPDGEPDLCDTLHPDGRHLDSEKLPVKVFMSLPVRREGKHKKISFLFMSNELSQF